MEFSVINGECAIGDVSITALSISSVVITGDLGRAALVSCFETPLERGTFGAVQENGSGDG